MKEVVSTSAVFFSYALLAIFAQNAVFTRALGVSRMVQLVGDDRTSSALFGMMLCITQVLVAPVAFVAGRFIAPLDNRAQLRPLVYIASIAVVCLAEHLVLWLLRSLPRRAQLLRIVPLAALNSGVLGTVLVERTQSFTLGQSLGFGLGSGLGYVLAVLLVTEARHRLRSKAIPKAFRGLPITLVYIASIAVVCLAEHLVLWLLRSLPRRSQLLRIVPLAALNSGVLGTVLVERTQSFTLGESLGFGLGSGLGYVLAVLLVTEARHRLRSKAIPKAFRGLPITLVYIGVLALAIYGFTGHSVIL